MTEEKRRERLIQSLETILRDVQDLLLDEHVFWELPKVIAANPKFNETSDVFTHWMASCFIQATAVGVRRQMKKKDSVSLASWRMGCFLDMVGVNSPRPNNSVNFDVPRFSLSMIIFVSEVLI